MRLGQNEVFEHGHITDQAIYHTYTLPQAGKAELCWEPHDPDTITLQNLYVAPHMRGIGIGSQLFDAAVKASAKQGFQNFNARLENERTAHCFRRLGESALISEIDEETWKLFPTDLSLDDAIRYLETWRVIHPQKREDSRIITPTKLHISARIQ